MVDPINDSVLYAATLGGVYKSDSAGQQWSPVNAGLWDLAVSTLAFSSDDQVSLYAGTNSGMIFVTTDGGQRWIELGKPVANKINRIVAVSQTMFAATPEGLFKSSDQGATWERESAAPELRNSYTWFVAISPSGDLYAGTSQGAFESRDGGRNWRRIYFGPGYAVEFGKDGSIYLAFGRGVIKSSDRGQNWQLAFEMPGYFVTALHLSDSGRWYAGTTGGLYEFAENGKLILGHALQGRPVAALAASRTSPRKYAGTLERGIFSKIENASDWTMANRGINMAFTNDVAVFPFEPSIIFAATTTGVFKTADSAQTWQKLSIALETNDVEIPAMSNIVYANEGKHLQKSLDEGATWKTINPNFTSGLAVAPSDPSTLYAALAAGMAKSTDGGDTWAYVMNDMPLGYYAWYYGFNATDVAIHPSDPSTVYVAQEAGFFKTINGGARWSPIQNLGLVRAVAIDPSEPSVVYASLNAGGVVKSQDGGATWSSKTMSEQSVNTLVINPLAASTIYAGTERGVVYRSDDGGREWHRFGNSLLGAVKRLSMDSSGNHLYAATTAGVFGYQIADIQIFPEGGDSSRLTRLLGELLEPGHGGPPGPGFVIPVVGLGAGANGTFFKTDLVLQNHRSTDQDIVLIFLAQGNSSGGGPFFRLTLNPFGQQEINIPDIVDRLGVSGLGSLIVIGVDRSGEFDADASFDGSSRICTQAPDRPLICQSVAAVRADLLAGHDTARVGGLPHDATARFRTNVGIVNLSPDERRFTIIPTGERNDWNVFEVLVPPFSLLQKSIPDDDYGTLTIHVEAQDAAAPWVFYASSVDNRSGASWTTIGTPAALP